MTNQYNHQIVINHCVVKETTLGKRVLEWVRMNDTSIYALAQAANDVGKKYGIKVTYSDLYNYTHETCVPKHEKLSVLCLTMGVSEPWLTGWSTSYKHV